MGEEDGPSQPHWDPLLKSYASFIIRILAGVSHQEYVGLCIRLLKSGF